MCQNIVLLPEKHSTQIKSQAKDKTDISIEETFKDFGPTDLC